MSRNFRRRFSRVLTIAIIIAILCVITSVLVYRKNADVRAGVTVLILPAPFAENSRSLQLYLGRVFVRFVSRRKLLRNLAEDRGCDSETASGFSLLCLPSSHEPGSVDLLLCGVGRETVPAVLNDLVARGKAQVAKKLKSLLISRIQGKERELEALKKTCCFKRSVADPLASAVEKRLDSLEVSLQSLRLMLEAPLKILVSSEPVIRSLPSARGRWMSILWIVIVSALFLSGIEFVLHRVRKRRCIVQLQRQSTLPTVAAVPWLDDLLITRVDAFGEASEAFRSLRSWIIYSGYRSLAFVSWGYGSGKSVVCANTAVVLAENGHDTLVIDGNLRAPKIHELFSLDNDIGLTDVLIDTDMDDVVWDTSDSGLRVLTAGPKPPDASFLLQGARLMRVITSAAGKGEMVLVDTPPVSACADAYLLSTHCDAAVFVIRPDIEDPDDVISAVRRLKRIRVPVCGMVLNGVELGQEERMAYALR